ncbi:MAG: hypothetical protein LBR27_07320 [Bifidobacteriaceae bacterium]|jgi:hypothetical protein|nr:hypothetical protein [Bifidobacteriaceae bacterium]
MTAFEPDQVPGQPPAEPFPAPTAPLPAVPAGGYEAPAQPAAAPAPAYAPAAPQGAQPGYDPAPAPVYSPQGAQPAYDPAAYQPPAPPKAKKAKKDKPPSAWLVYLGLVLILVSPLALGWPVLRTATEVSDVAADGVTLAHTTGMTEFHLADADYTIWSSHGDWDNSCTVAKGSKEINLSKVKDDDVPLPDAITDQLPAEAVRTFEASGGTYSLGCTEHNTDAVIYYFIPTIEKGWVTGPFIGAIAMGVLLLAGVVLLVTQEIRRSVWLRKHFKTATA